MAAPLTYELQREPCAGLVGPELGKDVELRELSYGALRRAMARAKASEGVGDAVLAASLHVDGDPIGLEALDAIPGHLSMQVANALARCLELHGLTSGRTAQTTPDENKDEDTAEPKPEDILPGEA